MKSLLALIGFLFQLSLCQDLQSLFNICENPPKTPPITISDKVALPEVYKVSGSVTDWNDPKTSLLVETATKNYRVLQKQSRDKLPERWIYELTGEKSTVFINVTSGTCKGPATTPSLFNNPRFEEIIGNKSSTMFDVINGLLEFDKTHTGYLVNDNSEIVGGVNAHKWISCVNGTTANDTKVLVEVRYAGEETIRPAQAPFSNPLVLSIRLAEVASFNTTTALSHMSIEFDRYELPTENEATIEHGIFCGNKNGTKLPLKEIKEYAAVIEYFDFAQNRSEVVEILYSKSNKKLIVAGSSMENGVKLLKVGPGKFNNGTDYIIHDFEYGYEFTLNRDACSTFGPLSESSFDVLADSNKTLYLKSFEALLVDPVLEFVQYHEDVDITGTRHRTFRALSIDEIVVEVHLTEDGELIDLATYHVGSRHLALTMKVTKIPIESSRLNLKLAQLSDCYDGGSFVNNTIIINIKNKNVTDVEKVGLNALNVAVAESITKNVYPVIPYRILVFWVEAKNGGLTILLRMSEKSEQKPAQVGYNYTAELSTGEVFKLMNQTVFEQKLSIEVPKSDGSREEWMVDEKSMAKYPPENDNQFIGYTGGSMFVLAIFCLLIGVSIGSAGVFIVTRRQRISTLAYQVFE